MTKEILCIIEIEDNKVKKSSLEIASFAAKLKELEGAEKISAAVLAEDPDSFTSELFSHGYDSVYTLKSPSFKTYRTQAFGKALTALVKNVNPGYVLVPGTGNGRALAPYLGVKLNAGVIADVIDAEKADGGVQFVRPCFAGNLLYYGTFSGAGTRLVTVRPKAFPIPAKAEGKSGETVAFAADIKEEEIGTRVLEVIKETGKISLQDADFIIGGGRGVGSADNFKQLEELASLLGGSVGASRAVVDSGWVAYEYQVGQTGKTVKPKIYFALGISGAIQHLAGMRTSDIIVAVNKDSEAPIFKIASFGIAEDLFKVMPVLTAELKKRLVK